MATLDSKKAAACVWGVGGMVMSGPGLTGLVLDDGWDTASLSVLGPWHISESVSNGSMGCSSGGWGALMPKRRFCAFSSAKHRAEVEKGPLT